MYKILSSILVLRLTPYIGEINGKYQCGFPPNIPVTDILCFRQTLEKKWEYNRAVHLLFIDFEKAFDSVRVKYYTVSSLDLAHSGN
jgi:hypothetical protein